MIARLPWFVIFLIVSSTLSVASFAEIPGFPDVIELGRAGPGPTVLPLLLLLLGLGAGRRSVRLGPRDSR